MVFSLFVIVSFTLVACLPLTTPVPATATTYACGTSKADLWFANDESGSVDANEFDDALDFMYQVSDKFNYSAATGMQAGAFAWDTSTNDVIIPITEEFADTDDTGLLQTSNVSVDSDGKGVRELYTAKAGGGGTNLTTATAHMKDLINGGNGRRSGVRQVAIFLTDATESQLTSDAANWIAQADALRSAGDGNIGIVLVLIAEASAAYTSGSAGPTVDAVAGTNGLIVTVPTYADAADPAKSYIDDVTTAVCDAVDPTPAPSDDNDNVTTTIEDNGPNNGDGNNDGFLDSTQTSVTTAVNNAIGAYTTTAVSGDCTQITAVNFYLEPNLATTDPDHDYPYGLHGFNVDCTAPGGTVNVVYYWNKVYDTSTWSYRKFNAATNKYIDFSDKVTYGTANVGGTTVTTVSYSVTDGGPYDGDGAVNGRIVDPVGPTLGLVATGSSIEKSQFIVGASLIVLSLAVAYQPKKQS